jgi:predicted GTPase
MRERAMADSEFNCLIMGAAGRDFHDFQTFFRDRPQFRVLAFTAAQIPFIAARSFPRELAGPNYDADIPIHPEQRLGELIRELDIDFVFLAYSDLSHEQVMHKASLVQSCGASFILLGPRHTQLVSQRPVVAVTATRTGAGKSPISQMLARHLRDSGRSVSVVRHPMPYGDLSRQRVQRFASAEDLDRFECTIEEREEYEPYVEQGLTIFAGVDYEAILRAAEAEADVVVWDGGNNDFSFFRPGLSIVVLDALRAGHETAYYPGETNFLSGDVLAINKVSQAAPQSLADLRRRVRAARPDATVIECDLEIEVEDPGAVAGRKVLVVEDGPTLTHGGMAYGAGTIAARKFGAAGLIDPRPAAVGGIGELFQKYPHLQNVLPAMGYSATQRDELKATILASGAEVVVDGSPARIDRLLELSMPVVRVHYRMQQVAGPPLTDLVDRFLATGSAPSEE